jgi:DNA primase
MNDAVQKIKDRLNIIDVISPYVELHKAGRHFKGKSPFTNEKTPSFYVSSDRGMYYCFSTSQGGDMFTFVQTMEGVDFKEALKILAEKANVELVPVSPEKKSERDRLYSALEEATKFYQKQLETAEEAKAYLIKRGLTPQTIEAWRIGFAPGPPAFGWGMLKEHLVKQGFKPAEIFKAGLIKESDKGKESYDVFRNRIMFPLFDQGGRVVGFSGRTLLAGPEIPKYVNSPETDLYKKSELLFGYDRAKHGIRNLDFSLIVEGQFDVVMSHQAGYGNTVAVSGTALTMQHVQLLERSSNRVVLALDADRAGIAAMKKAADLMLRRGFDVKVAVMPAGKDPADIILDDPKQFRKIIGTSVHVIEFLLKNLTDQKLEERTFKLRAREEVIPFVLLLPNHIDQDHFEGKIAEALKTTKEAIHYEAERILESKSRSGETVLMEAKAPVAVRAKENSSSDSFRYTALLTNILAVLPLLEEGVAKRVREILEKITGKSVEELEQVASPSTMAEVLFRAEVSLDKTPKKAFNEEFIHTLNQLRVLVIRQDLKQARERLQQAELLSETSEVESALKKVSELQLALQAEPVGVELFEA